MSWADLEGELAEMFGGLSTFSRQEQAYGYRYFTRGDDGVRHAREMRELEAMYARKAQLAGWLERLPPAPTWSRGRGCSPWKLVG
jgi:hypothetical protein